MDQESGHHSNVGYVGRFFLPLYSAYPFIANFLCTGPIPKELGNLAELRKIEFDDNSLSGEWVSRFIRLAQHHMTHLLIRRRWFIYGVYGEIVSPSLPYGGGLNVKYYFVAPSSTTHFKREFSFRIVLRTSQGEISQSPARYRIIGFVASMPKPLLETGIHIFGLWDDGGKSRRHMSDTFKHGKGRRQRHIAQFERLSIYLG